MRTILVSILNVFAIACSRGADNSVDLRLSFSGLGESQLSSTPKITFLAVTVTGGDMSPFVYTWESYLACPTCTVANRPSAPTSLSIQVPTGNKLIQVLAAQEEDGGASKIFYGDTQKTLSGSNESVGVSVSQVGATSYDGHVAGRWVRAGGTFPSGKMRMYVHPVVNGAARPDMAIFQSYVFAGWFRAFFVSGFDFSYVMEGTGERLFDHVDLTDIEAISNTPYRLNVKIPASYRTWNSSGVVGSTGVLKRQSRQILGYFGPGAGGSNKACYSNLSNVINHSYFSDINALNYLQFSATPSAIQMGPLSGGVSQASCNSANNYSAELFHRSFLPDSEDRALGIKGPFRLVDNIVYATFLKREDILGNGAVATSSRTVLEWNFLPDVGAEVSGVRIFAKMGEISEGGGPFGIDCPNLSSQGYTAVGESNFGTNQFTVNESSLSGTGFSRFALPYLSFVVCPYKDGAGAGGSRLYYTSAIVARGEQSFTAVTNPIPSLVPATQNDVFLTGANCANYELRLINSSGQVMSSPSGTYTFTGEVFSGGSLVQLYDAACSASLGTSDLSLSTEVTTLKLRMSAPVNETYLIAATGSGVTSKATVLFGSNAAVAGAYTGLATLGRNQAPVQMIRGRCYPVIIRRDDSIALTTDTTPLSIDLLQGAQGVFYRDSYCEYNHVSGTPGITFQSDEAYKLLYFRPWEVAAAPTLTADPSSGSNGVYGPVAFIDEVPAFLFMYNSSSPSPLSQCQDYYYLMTNASFEVVTLNLNKSVSITINSTGIYPLKAYDSVSNCVANGTAGLLSSIAAGGTGTFTRNIGPYSPGGAIYLRGIGVTGAADFGATTYLVDIPSINNSGPAPEQVDVP